MEEKILINTLTLKIWERDFTLPIVYDCLSDGVILEEQQDAINKFIGHLEWIDKAKNIVEEYCRKYVLEDEENTKKDNVFSYIKPEAIYVKYEAIPHVALMCKYRYDVEHGLAIVFSNKGEITVGSEDIVI